MLTGLYYNLVSDLPGPPALVAGYLGVLGQDLDQLALAQRQLVLALRVVVVQGGPEGGRDDRAHRPRRPDGVGATMLAADVHRADHVSIAGRFHGLQGVRLHKRRHPSPLRPLTRHATGTS